MEQCNLTKFKTWDEFWQKFLQIDFHSGNPERWSFRKKKAEWLLQNTSIAVGSTILDLGCGDGVLDIWLSRMGHQVTAVDRSKTVTAIAREEDDSKKVNFLASELMSAQFESSSFDLIVMIETLGLMSPSGDALILRNAYDWLNSKGKIVIDIPVEVPIVGGWTKEFDSGTAKCVSKFDSASRLQYIDFEFAEKNGNRFGLYDPYDKNRYDGPGLCRYLYSKVEMQKLLTQAGFEVTEIPHYYEKDYVAYMGVKK